MEQNSEILTEEQLTVDEIDDIAFDFKPVLVKSCKIFAKEYVDSLAEEQEMEILAEALEGFAEKKKSLKKQTKQLAKEVATAEEEQKTVDEDYQKMTETIAETGGHEKEMWTDLKTHLNDTFASLDSYNSVQQKISDVDKENQGLEEQAREMQAQVDQMTAKMAEMETTKAKLAEDKERLVSSTSASDLENTKEKLAKTNEKHQAFLDSMEEVRHLLWLEEEKGKQYHIAEVEMYKGIEAMQNKVNLTVTEANHLKLKIEAKKVDEERQIEAVQEKMKRVQLLCDTISGDLRAKLQVQLGAQEAEVQQVVQKNGCLEQTYKAQLEKQSSVEQELSQARADAWQRKEKLKEELKKMIVYCKDKRTRKQTRLERLHAKLKASKLEHTNKKLGPRRMSVSVDNIFQANNESTMIEKRRRSTHSEKNLEAIDQVGKRRRSVSSDKSSDAKKSKSVFKKPSTPLLGVSTQKQRTTNALFSSLFTSPKNAQSIPSVSGASEISEQGSLLTIQTGTDDDLPSIITMSSIGGLESFSNMSYLRDSDTQSSI